MVKDYVSPVSYAMIDIDNESGCTLFSIGCVFYTNRSLIFDKFDFVSVTGWISLGGDENGTGLINRILYSVPCLKILLLIYAIGIVNNGFTIHLVQFVGDYHCYMRT